MTPPLPATFALSQAGPFPTMATATPATVEEVLAGLSPEATATIQRHKTFDGLMEKVQALPTGVREKAMAQILAEMDRVSSSPKVQVAAPPLTSDDLSADDGLSVGFIDLVDVSKPTEEERISIQAREVERSARYAKDCRDNHTGIATGMAIGIGLLGLMYLVGIPVGMLPFSRVGGHHWISFALPATTRGWLWEIVGTLLMGCSFPPLWIYLRHPGEYSAGVIKGLIAILPYLFGAVCLGIGR